MSELARKTIWLYAKTPKVYPRRVGGFFARLRWLCLILTQLVFYGTPWLMWGERQAVLFDLDAKRFYLFALVLYPQDFIFLTALLVLCALGLFFVTAIAGRVWCGYACPQTVYSKLFLWIEAWVEGDRQRRITLDKAGWNVNKLWRKGLKHLIWLLLALATGLSFVGYFVPIRQLVADLATFQLVGWPVFWIIFYGLATWGNAGFMREQVCKYMCPYARFQSAMLDKDSLIVSYHAVRGEPRGSRKRGEQAQAKALGDCIDCTLCVQVCPVGIDIRNGLQYECIGCAACIDACDDVMEKMGSPKGLVSYTTQHHVDSRQAVALSWLNFSGERWMDGFVAMARLRVVIYLLLLIMVGSALIVGMMMRPAVRADVVRDRGVMSRELADGLVENVYRVQLMNTTERVQRVAIEANNPVTVSSESEVILGPAEQRWVALSLRVEGHEFKPGSHQVALRFVSDEGAVTEQTRFLMPRQ
jgi:cytochrome c oxidase accessory protein FixG